MMDGIGSDIGYRIELAPGDCRIQRAKAAFDPVHLVESVHARRVDIDPADQSHSLNGSKMLGMCIGHAPRTQNQQTHIRNSCRVPAAPMFKITDVIPAQAAIHPEIRPCNTTRGAPRPAPGSPWLRPGKSKVPLPEPFLTAV